jgi:ribonuclease HI
MRIYFDGGCRPNPGPIEIAAVARGQLWRRDDLGHGGSHEAEWLALLHAARIAIDLGAAHVEFAGDSLAVIRQARGVAKCRDAISQRHLAAYREAIIALGRVRLRHITRSKNLAGIALAKRHPR